MKLDDFEVIAVLGNGALATVSLVKRLVDGSYFALKRMDKKKIIMMKQLEHIHNEKELLASVDHPFVIKLNGTFQDTQYVYLVLEYCHGGDLFGLMGTFDDEIMPVEAARFYAASIVSAFGYIHQKNIVYRDLKTENLLLDRTGYLKVADFGFAKKLKGTKDRTWTLCGTPEHLAPEIIQNKGHNCAADWWTLGINLFEFLVGQPPFYDSTPIGTYRLIIGGKIKFPDGFDKGAHGLIQELLTADPAMRLGCYADAKHDGTVADVVAHEFFKSIDWKKLMNYELDPPHIPDVEDDEDISNFEEPDDEEEVVGDGITIKDGDFAKW